MTKKQKAKKVIELLKLAYPDVHCALIYEKPHELLIATRLSAQCTDKRVNMVTPALFERFPTVEAFADAQASEIEPYIQSCGLFKTKAHDITEMCKASRRRQKNRKPDLRRSVRKARAGLRHARDPPHEQAGTDRQQGRAEGRKAACRNCSARGRIADVSSVGLARKTGVQRQEARL